MAKFDASSAVEALEFDLSVYRPAVPDDPDHPDYERLKKLADEEWSGVIPEPTDEAVEQLFRVALPALRSVGEDAYDRYLAEQRAARRDWFRANRPGKDADALDNEALDALEVPAEVLAVERDRMAEITRVTRREARERTIAATAEFTQGHPSRAVLEALPWRAFQMFCGWLTGQFSPETLAAAMDS
jgi:hypothetical protein